MEGKMKSKIERSELDVLEDILQEVQENNELMQELLADGEPQSQPEENNFVHTVGTPMLESTTTCSWDTPEGELTDKKKGVDGGVDRKDTPEEWEDRIRDLILDISADRLVSSERVVAIVQSLLDDREREVLENMRDWVVEYTLGNYKVRDFDAEIAIGKIIDRELDKLNSKKK